MFIPSMPPRDERPAGEKGFVSLRDHFAMAALTGLLSNVQRYQNEPLTRQAFEIAAFMLRERDRNTPDSQPTLAQGSVRRECTAPPSAASAGYGSGRTGENIMTIWKQAIDVRTNVVRMPWPFTILSVQSQENRLHLWAEVEADNPVTVTRSIEVYGTGWEIPEHPEQRRFIGTVQTGPLVWHVYERGDGRVSTP